MTRRSRRTLAMLIYVPAGLAAAVSGSMLVAGYVQTLRQATADKDRLAQLESLGREDLSRVSGLVAERQRQTQASLARSAENTRWSRVLIIAAACFLAGIKWFIAMGGRRSPPLQDVLRERGVAPRSQGSAATLVHACRGRTAAEDEIDLSAVDEIVGRWGRTREAAIPILQDLQSQYHYLPDAALNRVCELTDITPSQIVGTASFYTQFRRTPRGRHLVRVCHGTACHVAGAEGITTEMRRLLGIGEGSDTDADMQYTIEPVACMGCCTLAPVAQIDGVTHGHLEVDSVASLLREDAAGDSGDNGSSRRTRSRDLQREGHAPAEIRIGLGSCCVAGGSAKVFEAMERELAAVDAHAVLKRVGCVGMCHQTPLIEAIIPGRPAAMYAGVTPADVRTIVRRHFRPRTAPRLLLDGLSTALQSTGRHDRPPVPRAVAIERRDPPVAAFLGPQKHIVTEHGGSIDPVCFEEYVRHDGFEALRKCVDCMTPEAIIAEIRRSGLRGRGGAGFPSGEKWARVRESAGATKYVICNGDEGDPGAFMDRMLMESFPYRILEGLAIAAYAVGAGQAFLYIRAEYPLAVQRISEAIEECERRGVLGKDAPGTGFRLEVRVRLGAGAFVCGEETALIASLEGERGVPRLRPPYPSEKGLKGAPTLVSNVETLATVPWIFRNSASAFASLGTPSSPGTKVFALAGKVNRGGLIEVPMGVTIRQIVEDIGGGIKHGRRFKAVQIGGPSGGCLPADLADTPVDYEALAEAGAIMGSGGLVVLDETDCMVDIARYFLAFTQDQSCGKCTYCRIGTLRMLDILNRLCEGKGVADDLVALEALARSVIAGSLCGLGKTAPNPVLTTLRYFREEYEAHTRGRCPAGRCKAIIKYRITDRCIGCTLCAQYCPADAIEYAPYRPHEIDDAKCTRCDVCRIKCPEEAVLVE